MRFIANVLVGLGLLTAVSTAIAADDEEPRRRAADLTTYEIMPFAGFRMAGDFDIANTNPRQRASLQDDRTFGLAFEVRRDESSQYELLYSRQETQLDNTSPLAPLDVNVEYLHLGGTLDVNEDLALRPYIVGGLGLTRFTLQSGSDDTRFSFSLGAGVRVPVTARFNIRLEARGFLTLIDTDSAIFCASGSFGGVCSIRAKGSSFTQFELLAGAAFAF